MKKKIKLPRKRKKAYIKSRGRQNYRGMLVFLPMENETKFPKDVAPYINAQGIPDFAILNYW